MKIYLATDHAGFQIKENIKLFLEIEKEEILKKYNENAFSNIAGITFIITYF
jgi:ribose 5-phosphate isomerase RpiB